MTTLAICYDFDGTLAPGNMQDHSLIPALGTTKEQFWLLVNQIIADRNLDETLTYLNMILKLARQKGIFLSRQYLAEQGAKIPLFAGLDTWFDRINAYADANGIAVEHYIISSGNAEMIEGTSIAPHFKRIYGCRFVYDEEGQAVELGHAPNDTQKTRRLFGINKGALDEADKRRLNQYMPKHQRPIPFSNMIYLGDGLSDVPPFQVVTDNGGLSIAVYDPELGPAKAETFKAEGRVLMAAPADYREGSLLEAAIKTKIEEIAWQAFPQLERLMKPEPQPVI